MVREQRTKAVAQQQGRAVLRRPGADISLLHCYIAIRYNCLYMVLIVVML